MVFDNALGDAGAVDGTAVVIINPSDVIVVDAQWSPATARRVIAEIRKLTPNPVRYVINTHWHGDHWFGNQAYRDAFPGVEFIAHENTLVDLEARELTSFDKFRTTDLPAMIADFEKRIAAAIRRDGKPYTAADSAIMKKQLAALKWAGPVINEVTPVRPTLTIADSLVLRRGDRQIIVRYLGRGNTRGDLSVWLPAERVLITGDLLVNPAPYSFFSYLGDWTRTLGALRALPAAAIVPGHGAVQRDWTYFDLVGELLRATLSQARDAVTKGLDLEGTRKAVDLSAFRERFARGDAAIGRAFDAFFVAPAVERAWLEARGELDKPPPVTRGTAGTAAAAQAPDGNTVVQRMRDTWSSRMYRTMTFVQETQFDGRPTQTWYESMRLPGALRIDVAPVDSGNAILFLGDSTFRFRRGQPAAARADGNILAIAFGDAYVDPTARTVSRLERAGVNLARTHRASWNGDSVVVVGAEAGDSTSAQLWVRMRDWRAVRVMEPTASGAVADIVVTGWSTVDGFLTESEIDIKVGGKVVQREIYRQIRMNPQLDEAIFSTTRYVVPAWITSMGR